MTFKLNPSLHKALVLLIDKGCIFYDSNCNEYVGIMPNGQEVGLGCNPDQLEKYLADYPSPDTW